MGILNLNTGPLDWNLRNVVAPQNA
jgi:hypothetical protein